MLTLTELGEMTAQQRTDVFDTLLTKLFPDSTNRAETACENFGITKPTFFGWRRNHRVPVTVILLMQEWALKSGVVAPKNPEIEDWKDICAKLTELSETIQRSNAQIADLADRLGQMGVHRAHALSENDADDAPVTLESQKPSAE